MAGSRQESEVSFFLKPDSKGIVVAQVTDPQSPPITMELGKPDRLLYELDFKALQKKLARAAILLSSYVLAADGILKVVGSIFPEVTYPLINKEWAPYHIPVGLIEFTVAAGIGITVGRTYGEQALNRINLIRSRWVQEKISQIPLDQPPALAEVAPQKG